MELLTKEQIERFYNRYKNSISSIRKLETTLLKESYSYDKWSVSLREKSIETRKLYMANQQGIEEVIKPFIECPVENITEEIADQFITHIDFFTFEGYRDYQAVVPVLEKLIQYYKINGPEYRLFDCYYFMGSDIMEMHEYENSQEYFNLALEIYSGTEAELEPYRLYRVFCALYFRFYGSLCEKNIDQQKICKYADALINGFPEESKNILFTEKKKIAIREIVDNVIGFAVSRLISEKKPITDELMSIVNSEFERQKENSGNEKNSALVVDSRIYVVYYKYQHIVGNISDGEYSNLIMKKYEFEKDKYEDGFEYGTSIFTQLFDDELLDEDFAYESLFYMNPCYTYVHYLLPEVLDIYGGYRTRITDDIEKDSLINEIFLQMKKYYSGLPFVSGDYLIDFSIELQIRRIFKYIKDVDIIFNLLDYIYIGRQVMTVIHSYMVSILAETIARHLAVNRPELFVGVLGYTSEKEVIDSIEDIAEFAKGAGKCHDIGKIICSDIINLQSRRISDKEFGIIKGHPVKGYDILSEIEQLKKYRDVAIGHHKSFDGKRGYPMEFDNTKSDIKIFIDIITICDCIDAATDRLGRNYANAKDFDDLLMEFKQDKGTRYCDEIVDVLERDEELKKEMRAITSERRQTAYYEIYHKFVEPDVKFRPKDEKYIRMCRASDLEKIAMISGSSVKEQKKLFLECNGSAYAVIDGYGDFYGFVFASINSDFAEIKEIIVNKPYRYRGYGSMLLQTVVNVAKKQECTYIKMQAVKEGHYDKFCWRNGFSEYISEDVMKMDLT